MLNDIKKYNNGIRRVLEVNKFEKINNSTVMIFGINGLIGSAIVDVLNYLNEYEEYSIKIIGTVRNKKKTLDRFKNYKNLIIVEQDIVNPIVLRNKVDYVINCASNSHPQKFSTDPVGTMVTNFIGTKNVLDFGLKKKVKRILFVSSGEIYGQATTNIDSFDEEYNGKINSMNSRSCYPISKLSAETLCASYKEQFDVDSVVVRPCHTYGPTQQDSDSRASAQFIRDVLNDKDIIMKSDGSQVRSYCYVLDCVTGILSALLYGEICSAYNIANNNSVLSIREMAEKIAINAQKKVVFEIPSDSEKKGYNPVTRSVLNGSKLEKIGWRPCYSFDEGIKETIDIMK